MNLVVDGSLNKKNDRILFSQIALKDILILHR